MEKYDLILIALTVLALVVRRSKIVVLAISLSVPAALVANSSIGVASQTIIIGTIYLVMSFCSRLIVKHDESEPAYMIQWLALACSSLCFLKLFILGYVDNNLWHNLIQKQIESVFLLMTTFIAFCLFLKDKSVGLHELARDIRHGVSWLRNISSIRSDGGTKS